MVLTVLRKRTEGMASRSSAASPCTAAAGGAGMGSAQVLLQALLVLGDGRPRQVGGRLGMGRSAATVQQGPRGSRAAGQRVG